MTPIPLPRLERTPVATSGRRFWLTRLLTGQEQSSLAQDVRAGLSAVPKTLLPKYFYDERGSQLFDAICDTEEYYPTRTEQALLEAHAPAIVAEHRPTGLIELGSGAARKTRVILDALTEVEADPRYVPVDISEEILVESGRALLDDYPMLRVHGVVADYDHHLHLLPEGPRRLIAFLGGTLGNFDPPAAIDFLRRLGEGMTAGDRLLLGLDLVKEPAVLHAAYNDAAGITAEFNKNVLLVMNRELGANFDVDGFEHVARFRPELSQIEMYLRALRAQRVRIETLGREVVFAAGEEMRTEISRKFTRDSVTQMIAAAGLELRGWYAAPQDYYALVVAGIPRSGA